jgi:hypothetical protein
MLTHSASNGGTLEAQAASIPFLWKFYRGRGRISNAFGGFDFVERGLRLFGGRCEVIFALWDVLDCTLLRVENG